MEKDAISLESRLQTLTPGPDTQAMSASLTGTRTSLVTLHTQAEAHTARIARYKRERMKRVEEVKKYQSLLIDLEHWLVETQRTITTEIRLSSVKAVKDQIRASETLVQDIGVRERQLNDLLIECNHLIPYTDVQEMAGKMAAHLNVLKTTFDDAQQILQVRLKNLQDALEELLKTYPDGNDPIPDPEIISFKVENNTVTKTRQRMSKMIVKKDSEGNYEELGDDWEIVDSSLKDVNLNLSSSTPPFTVDVPPGDSSLEYFIQGANQTSSKISVKKISQQTATFQTKRTVVSSSGDDNSTITTYKTGGKTSTAFMEGGILRKTTEGGQISTTMLSPTKSTDIESPDNSSMEYVSVDPERNVTTITLEKMEGKDGERVAHADIVRRHVSRRVIKKTRVVRKISIINGVEHVTEEVIEEPDEVDTNITGSVTRISRDPVEIPIIREPMQAIGDSSGGVIITELSDTEPEPTEAEKLSSDWKDIPISIENKNKRTSEEGPTDWNSHEEKKCRGC
jgi:hypothetical protein